MNALDQPMIRDALVASMEHLSAEAVEQARLVAAHVQLQREAEAKLAALRLLLGMPDPSQPPAPAPPEPAQQTWADFVIATLTAAKRPMTHREIIAEMAGTPIAERFARSPNSFYARIAKLEGASKLIRRGKLIYLPTMPVQPDDGLFSGKQEGDSM